jgi:hypothetical protein
MLDQLKSWLDLAQIGQSRSSITNPLQWTMVILIGGMVLCAILRLPDWIIIVLLVCLALVVALFLYAYLHFMHTKPDVLRSEQFHLQKLAIEHGLVGDSIHGLIDETKAALAKGDVKLLNSSEGAEQGR